MGLDGGTTMTRTDILRRSSWRVSSRCTALARLRLSPPKAPASRYVFVTIPSSAYNNTINSAANSKKEAKWKDSHSRSTRGGQVSASYVAGEECASPADLAAAKWSTCALTGEPLQEPIVACHLGKLYNRLSVVQLLLGRNGVFQDEAAQYRYKNQLPFISDYDHLRSLKDVFTLHPFPPLHSAEGSGKVVGWVCPITGLAAGGTNHHTLTSCGPVSTEIHRERCQLSLTSIPYSCLANLSFSFSALPTCGHAFASKALRELSDSTCPSCTLPYPHSEVVPLNGTTQQVTAGTWKTQPTPPYSPDTR